MFGTIPYLCSPQWQVAGGGSACARRRGDRCARTPGLISVRDQKGLRQPLREFGLRLFTFTDDGRVAARLEGSFGNGAFTRAVEAALDG